MPDVVARPVLEGHYHVSLNMYCKRMASQSYCTIFPKSYMHGGLTHLDSSYNHDSSPLGPKLLCMVTVPRMAAPFCMTAVTRYAQQRFVHNLYRRGI